MKIKELDEILTRLKRVSRSPRLQSDQYEAVAKAIKELEQIRRSGKLDRKKAFRASARVAGVLLQILNEESVTAQESRSDTL